MYQAYVKKAEESRERLVHQDKELADLETRIEEVKDQEQTEYNRIQELRETIRQVEFETGELTKKKNELEKELEEMVSQMVRMVCFSLYRIIPKYGKNGYRYNIF